MKIEISTNDESVINLFQYLKIKHNLKQNTDVLTLIICNYAKISGISKEDVKKVLMSKNSVKVRKKMVKELNNDVWDIYEANNIMKRMISMLSQPLTNDEAVYNYVQKHVRIGKLSGINTKAYATLEKFTISDMAIIRREIKFTKGMDERRYDLKTLDGIHYAFNDLKS